MGLYGSILTLIMCTDLNWSLVNPKVTSHAFCSECLGMLHELELNSSSRLRSWSLVRCDINIQKTLGCTKGISSIVCLDVSRNQSVQLKSNFVYLFFQGGSCCLDFAPCMSQYSLLIVYPSQSPCSNTKDFTSPASTLMYFTRLKQKYVNYINYVVVFNTGFYWDCQFLEQLFYTCIT